MFTDLALGLILIDILSNIAHWLIVAVGVLGFFTMMFVLTAPGWDMSHRVWPILKKFLYFAGTAIFVASLIPSKQTLYIALGLHTTGVVATQVAESEVGKKALNALEVKLDEILDQTPVEEAKQ